MIISVIEASSLQEQGEKKILCIFTLDRAPVVRQINVPFTKTEKVGGTSTSGAAPQLLHYAVCLFAYFFDGSLIPIVCYKMFKKYSSKCILRTSN